MGDQSRTRSAGRTSVTVGARSRSVLAVSVATTPRASASVAVAVQPGRLALTGIATVKEPAPTFGVTLPRCRWTSGTASIHTVCQIPVVRV